MAMRWLVVQWLVIVGLTGLARAEQQGSYSCYSSKGLFDEKPRVYCELDCEAELANVKQLYPDTTKFTECAPATGSVWCTMGFGPRGIGEVEQCFAERDACISANVKNFMRARKRQPLDQSVCVDKGPTAQATAATEVASATPADAGTVAEAATADAPVPDAPASSVPSHPHHYMVYGGLLAAGEEPDNSTAVALGLEHRGVGKRTVSYAVGVDAVGHYDSGPRGFGGRVALRAGIGGRWRTGSAGFTAGVAYGGVERSAAEIPFELFVNGSVLGVGVLLRYEQVHRFVENPPMSDTRFMNASGLSAWIVLWGRALDPKLSIGVRMQSRDSTDAAFFNAAWGVALP